MTTPRTDGAGAPAQVAAVAARPGIVDVGIVVGSLTAGAGILVGATALVPWLITGGFAPLVGIVSLGVPAGLVVVAGVLRLRARRGRGLLLAAMAALALVGAAAAVLLARDLSQVMNGVEGTFGELAVAYLALVLGPPLATIAVVAQPAVGRWLAGGATG